MHAPQMPGRLSALQREVRMAARALARAGLVHAYGHCSARLDEGHFLVCAAKPMGTITPSDAGVPVAIEGALPEGVLGEVRLHQMAYARRPDIGGVCRIMPPILLGLSLLGVTPEPRHGPGAYFAPRPPLWGDPGLLRDDARADALIRLMGDAPAVVMRANGAVTVAGSLPDAVTLAWFLEDAARIESFVRLHGAQDKARLSADETASRQVTAGRVFERMWEHLTHGDPEG